MPKTRLVAAILAAAASLSVEGCRGTPAPSPTPTPSPSAVGNQVHHAGGGAAIVGAGVYAAHRANSNNGNGPRQDQPPTVNKAAGDDAGGEHGSGRGGFGSSGEAGGHGASG